MKHSKKKKLHQLTKVTSSTELLTPVAKDLEIETLKKQLQSSIQKFNELKLLHTEKERENKELLEICDRLLSEKEKQNQIL